MTPSILDRYNLSLLYTHMISSHKEINLIAAHWACEMFNFYFIPLSFQFRFNEHLGSMSIIESQKWHLRKEYFYQVIKNFLFENWLYLYKLTEYDLYKTVWQCFVTDVTFFSNHFLFFWDVETYFQVKLFRICIMWYQIMWRHYKTRKKNSCKHENWATFEIISFQLCLNGMEIIFDIIHLGSYILSWEERRFPSNIIHFTFELFFCILI